MNLLALINESRANKMTKARYENVARVEIKSPLQASFLGVHQILQPDFRLLCQFDYVKITGKLQVAR